MDFANTRQENDEKLLQRLTAIEAGKDLEALEPFAKAYLGLYYDIDNRVPADDRITMLANPPLAEAICKGFVASLQRDDLPECGVIAAEYEHQASALAYITLAGMDILAKANMQDVLALDERVLQTVICFHLTTQTFHNDVWYSQLLQDKPTLVGDSLLQLWQPMQVKQTRVLPGLHEIIKEPVYQPVLAHVVIPLLQQMPDCRAAELMELLAAALKLGNHEQLSALITDVLQDMEQLPLRNRVYWLASGFILQPEHYGQTLINFMGQEKIKLLPLLDFSHQVLTDGIGEQEFPAMGYAYLIRCLAPRFTPQEDNSGNLGEITASVLWLFHQLAKIKSSDGRQALLWLQNIRVLKLYKEVFRYVGELQQMEQTPEITVFIQQLQESGDLRMKKKWSDAR